MISNEDGQRLLKKYAIPVKRGVSMGVDFSDPGMNRWGWVNIQTLSYVFDKSPFALLSIFKTLSRDFKDYKALIPLPFVTKNYRFVSANEAKLVDAEQVLYVPAGWAVDVIHAFERDVMEFEILQVNDNDLEYESVKEDQRFRWNFIRMDDEFYAVYARDKAGERIAP